MTIARCNCPRLLDHAAALSGPARVHKNGSLAIELARDAAAWTAYAVGTEPGRLVLRESPHRGGAAAAPLGGAWLVRACRVVGRGRARTAWVRAARKVRACAGPALGRGRTGRDRRRGRLVQGAGALARLRTGADGRSLKTLPGLHIRGTGDTGHLDAHARCWRAVARGPQARRSYADVGCAPPAVRAAANRADRLCEGTRGARNAGQAASDRLGRLPEVSEAHCS